MNSRVCSSLTKHVFYLSVVRWNQDVGDLRHGSANDDKVDRAENEDDESKDKQELCRHPQKLFDVVNDDDHATPEQDPGPNLMKRLLLKKIENVELLV